MPSKNNTQDIKKYTHVEHVLKIPDTYIGSTELSTEELWVYQEEHNKMVKETLTFCPGEYKIFDEILVNALDQYVRINQKIQAGESDLIPVKNIRVSYDTEENCISVQNDGEGISVELHPTENIEELIEEIKTFMNLLPKTIEGKRRHTALKELQELLEEVKKNIRYKANTQNRGARKITTGGKDKLKQITKRLLGLQNPFVLLENSKGELTLKDFTERILDNNQKGIIMLGNGKKLSIPYDYTNLLDFTKRLLIRIFLESVINPNIADDLIPGQQKVPKQIFSTYIDTILVEKIYREENQENEENEENKKKITDFNTRFSQPQSKDREILRQTLAEKIVTLTKILGIQDLKNEKSPNKKSPMDFLPIIKSYSVNEKPVKPDQWTEDVFIEQFKSLSMSYNSDTFNILSGMFKAMSNNQYPQINEAFGELSEDLAAQKVLYPVLGTAKVEEIKISDLASLKPKLSNLVDEMTGVKVTQGRLISNSFYLDSSSQRKPVSTGVIVGNQPTTANMEEEPYYLDVDASAPVESSKSAGNDDEEEDNNEIRIRQSVFTVDQASGIVDGPAEIFFSRSLKLPSGKKLKIPDEDKSQTNAVIEWYKGVLESMPGIVSTTTKGSAGKKSEPIPYRNRNSFALPMRNSKPSISLETIIEEEEPSSNAASNAAIRSTAWKLPYDSISDDRSSTDYFGNVRKVSGKETNQSGLATGKASKAGKAGNARTVDQLLFAEPVPPILSTSIDEQGLLYTQRAVSPDSDSKAGHIQMRPITVLEAVNTVGKRQELCLLVIISIISDPDFAVYLT